MKLYTTMPKTLVPYFEAELVAASEYLIKDNLRACWRHYERAHIIGQKYPFQHTLVHWKMLQFGIKVKSAKEIIGQIPRLVFGGVKSFVGHIPTGNTGGANVPPLQSMEISDELKEIIAKNS